MRRLPIGWTAGIDSGTVRVMLTAGIARVDITPSLPIDLVGYSRRVVPATLVRAPLTATALVIRSETTTAAIVAVDVAIISPEDADLFREAIGREIDAPADNVMLSVSHTHAGPMTRATGVKIGGFQRERSANEMAFIEQLPRRLVNVAAIANRSTEPVRVAGGVGWLDLAINRRQKDAEGRMILGWNPDKPVDREVGVVRFDRLDGTTLAVVANYACHPVVVGPEDPAVNPDFPGPMREIVEDTTGATCLFLQGACGNLLPLEAFFDHAGPEVDFGRRLGVEVCHVLDSLEPVTTEIRRIDYGSVTPITLQRRLPVEPQSEQPLVVTSRTVELPLKSLPTLAELEAKRDGYRQALDEAKAAHADRVAWNPIEYHLNWSEDAIEQMKRGKATPDVSAFLQAIRIGDVVIASMPGEAFSELAIAVKQRSPAATTLFAAYTNGVLTYLPTAVEYVDGGYECDYAHHSYGLVEQIAPESEKILVETSVALLSEAF